MSAAGDRVVDLFSAALELPPAERLAFLDRECDGDPELRSEVASLLRVDDRAGVVFDDLRLRGVREGMEAIIARAQAGEWPARETAEDPLWIGTYRVTDVLGEGGMGRVYAAIQDQTRRRVAVKVIRPERLTPEVLARFEKEAEFMGRLGHPGIVRIYECGVFKQKSQELPYLAMELVLGKDLLTWAQEDAPDIATRIRLLAETADAVHHAHEHGIIHRDLKPRNILVDAEGKPHILDFGIARAADPSFRSETDPTSTGQIVGTLAYMSPEQLDGQAHELSFSADVYSLGIIAFELLSGQLPYDVGRKPYSRVLRLISTQSHRSLGSVDRSLKGELEVIVGKAMTVEPEHRYASARHLAEDLRRYIHHEPVLARPSSSLYHLRKFARRNPALAILSGVLLLVMIAATIALSLAVSEARRAESAARQREREARWQTYCSEMHQAGHLLLDDPIAAGLHLQRAGRFPEARGWEWHHLKARLAVGSRDLMTDAEPVGPLSFDPASERLISALADGTAVMWNPRSDESTHITVPGEHLTAATFDCSSGELILGTSQGEVLFSSVDDPESVSRRCVIAAGTAIEGVTWNRASRTLFAWCGEEQFLKRGEGPTRILPTDVSDVADAAFDAEGRHLAVAGSEGWKLLQLPSLTPIVLTGRAAWSVAFLPGDEGMLVGTEYDGLVRVRFDGTRHPVLTSGGPISHVRPASGGAVLIIRDHRRFELVASTEEEAQAAWPIGGTHARAMACSPDGRQVVVALAQRSKLRWWRVPDSDPQVLVRHDSFAYGVAVGPAGRLVASIDFDGRVGVIDVISGRELASWQTNAKRFVRFGPRGRHLYLYSHRMFTTSFSFEVIDLLTGRRSTVSLQDDGFAACLDALRTGGELVLPPGIAARPDGGLYVTPSAIDAIVVWRAEHLDPARDDADASVLPTGGLGVTAATFAPDGRTFATASQDGTARLWDARTLEPAGVIAVEGPRVAQTPRRQQVYDVLFSADGRRLLTASRDGALRVWDTATLDGIVRLGGHRGYIHDLEADPRGRFVLSASGDGTVRIWKTDRLGVEEHTRDEAQRILAEIDGDTAGFDDVVAMLEAPSFDADDAARAVRAELVVRCLEASRALRLSPGLVDFGLVRPSEVAMRTVTLRNTGADPVTIEEVTLEAQDPAAASLRGVPPERVMLRPGESMPLVLHFQSDTSGSWQGRLLVRNSLGQSSYPLRAGVAAIGPPKARATALRLNGNGGWIRLPAMPIPDDFSWEFRIRELDGGLNSTLLSSKSFPADSMCAFMIQHQFPVERMKLRIGQVGRTYPFDSCWACTHLAVVHQGSETVERTISFYRNGSLVARFPCGDGARVARSHPWAIGQSWDHGRPSDYFRGEVHGVRLWGRALDPEELPQLATAPLLPADRAGLLGAWDLGGDGTKVRDASGHGHHGEIVGLDDGAAVRVSVARPNRVLQLRRPCQRVTLAPIPTQGVVAFDLWFDAGADRPSVSLVGAFTTATTFVSARIEEGRLRILSGSRDLDTGEVSGGWHHLAVVVDPTSGRPAVSVALDGKWMKRQLELGVDRLPRQMAWTLGGGAAASAPVAMDDFRIWRRALSPDEVESLAAGKEVLRGDPGLALLWSFEGAGARIRDDSGHGNDGRLEGFADAEARLLTQ